ncbi:lipoprotein [Burkholderia sp. SFA1]|uniref:peptidoglycan DD-metalloendopeptidase family protein n=1 Tax=Caballeronia sp. CLC5 TaxID=2906764 RepID=UPI001F1739D2|nr:peptidoglycan DD-metalloendopeptidase family protein [Caballeronia sp. CLC5]MCE4574237.1 peptidoglycan DD-metalloendopeptidase family protein [Caballeronia sp. CLC5]BBP99620.1 lipoprotein [Burkholderia sp. SFA1]
MQFNSINTHGARRKKAGAASVFMCASLILTGCAGNAPKWAPEPASPDSLTVRAVEVAAPPGYYVAAPGDTLASIAVAYGRDVPLLAAWNGMTTDANVVPGMRLHVGPPATVAVAQPATASAPAVEPKAGAFPWPVNGPVIAAFGTAGSKGIRIGGSAGAPIKSVRDGRVVYLGKNIPGYGNLVVIKHDQHLITAYGTLRRTLVREGATVKQGQVIAEMGAQPDGLSSLLFEVRKDRTPVDPSAYLGSQ